MASSVDSSVKRMISRINEMETSRRLVMMRLKETEVNLSYLAEEQTRHKQNNASLLDKEASLVRQLQAAVEEQRQLQTRHQQNILSVATAIQQEPALLRLAEQKIEQATSQRDLWVKRTELLSSAQRKWKATEDSMEEKKQQLEVILKEIQELEMEEQALLAEEAEAAVARQLQRQQQQQQQVEVPSLADAMPQMVGGAAALVAIKARMESEAVSAEEYVVQSTRQCSIVQREVNDLEKRMGEFHQWLNESNATKQQLEAEVAEIQLALTRKVCTQCA